MHIGFDISQTGSGKAGCGYFAHAMIQALQKLAPTHRYSLYPSFGDFYFDIRMPVFNPYPGHTSHYGPRHLTRETAREFWNASAIDHALGFPDIIHSNNFWCRSQPTKGKLLYTLYDLGFLVDSSWTTEANRIGCFDGVFRAALAADWIVAISKASRDHFLRVFPHFPEERVRVIYPCSRFTDMGASGSRPGALANIPSGKFWLSVGTIEPRKNQRLVAQAYAGYRAMGGAPMPLVFAGGKGWLMDDFQEYLIELGVSDQVIVTNYVSDDELIWLYRNCYGHLYASLFEGFGLPVLEGMQFGAPSLVSSSSSIPEVAGKAALLLDPGDVNAWSHAMLKLLVPATRERLKEAGPRQAALFDWKHSAGELLMLYDEAASLPKRVYQ